MRTVLLAYYVVQDAARFVEAFDAFEDERVAAGVVDRALVESAGDPRRLVAILGFASRRQAEAFTRSPARRDALDRGGVTSHRDEIHDVVRPFEGIDT